MIRFGIVLLATAASVACLMWFAHRQSWIENLPTFLAETLIFLVFCTLTIFVYLYKLSKPGLFVTLYLLSMAVKLVAYGAYNLLMIISDKEGAIANVVFFMAVYALCTGLEVAFLYQRISRSGSS